MIIYLLFKSNYKFKKGVMLGKKAFLKSICSAVKGWEIWFIAEIIFMRTFSRLG